MVVSQPGFGGQHSPDYPITIIQYPTANIQYPIRNIQVLYAKCNWSKMGNEGYIK
jgi:hypothetical protein